MKKQIYLVANWKSHKTIGEAREFFGEYSAKSEAKIIVCPPMPYLFELSQAAKEKGISLGAQDISNFPFGAYTGAVAASMIRGVAEFVILGHSERRKYFGETNEVIAQKARNVLEAEMTPILCVDQPYLESQLGFFEANELRRMIVAYEPLVAIGTGQPDSPEAAEEVAITISRLAQTEVSVIYGGSVKAENAARFVAMEHIAGVLVGGASLSAYDWSELVRKTE